VRHGDVHIPRIDLDEPLALECRAFLRAITDGERPPSGAAEGLAVVRVLAAAQRSLDAGGVPVDL
jgi:predicted dehydrogenase